ncbi:MAG: MBOAT family protein [Chthoniobacteraceae bacterium]|nr:MBOAT family protein [Chthoniobacteraceae bacterium]
MLFNSYIFIFAFLPIVFLGFYLIGQYRSTLALLWLAAASLFFYGWWDVRFVGLLLGSIVFNYGAAYGMGRLNARGSPGAAKILLAAAIAGDLLLLGYFKYAHFFAENLNQILGTRLPLSEVFLPLGISFFTFTQIAFLVDTCQGKAKETNFIHYALFVTYFPHLIAGPILHHGEMMPQFARRDVCRLDPGNVAAGLGIFVLGLAKKLWIADPLGAIATPVFNAAAAGGHPYMLEAWIGALAYTLQLYFDFSGYCDMAIGLSLLFNVRLPMNFDSPYKSTSVIEFWRRWHMTLSRYLRDYLYIPLGGSRKGLFQRYRNLVVTMLLGGLWHGAGWTFVIWGGLHGFFLVVNHAWRLFKTRMGWGEGGRLTALGSGALTFVAVTVGWVFFRASSAASALAVLGGMAGANGAAPTGVLAGKIFRRMSRNPESFFRRLLPSLDDPRQACLFVIAGLVIAWGLPNVRQLFLRHRPTCEDLEREEPPRKAGIWPGERLARFFTWENSARQGVLYGVLFFLLIAYLANAAKSEFLYFQF